MREPRNRIFPHRPDPRPPTLRKVPADSVPFISRNGRTVWAAYDGDGTLVCVAATADEARIKYREELKRREREEREKRV